MNSQAAEKMTCPACDAKLLECECGIGARILDAGDDPQVWHGRPYPEMEAGPSGAYHYSLHRTYKNSDHFGPCAVCGDWCGDVYSQKEWRAYTRINGTPGMTQRNSYALYGHKGCLEGARR